MIVMGEIDAYKIGGVYRITEGALFDFLEKHKFKSHWKKSAVSLRFKTTVYCTP
jgi:hypothetical protein